MQGRKCYILVDPLGLIMVFVDTADSVKEWDSAKLYANHLQVVVKKYAVFRWAKEYTKSERN
ncbi:hypothetical protein AU255_17625 [Methyloprofundus sedimenti]|uniref:Uncharacterized protein n=2 Tax=Methyloprofundus sedimenti TaxID=1420851 RepID=A0A1V8M1J3_9GAMM|nr:hypothetical protein AU255_17625 [Methyloprofundus sedimenti]